MTIGIISDTHSYLDPALHRHFKECDEIWHAGDIGDLSVLEELQQICGKVRAVCGNIDATPIRRVCPELLEFEAAGVKVLLTHIGGYPGKYAPGMKNLLREHHIGLMVCGHSHIVKAIPDPELGLLHLNPGAAGKQGWQRERTVMRLTISDGQPRELELITLGGDARTK